MVVAFMLQFTTASPQDLLYGLPNNAVYDDIMQGNWNVQNFTRRVRHVSYPGDKFTTLVPQNIQGLPFEDAQVMNEFYNLSSLPLATKLTDILPIYLEDLPDNDNMVAYKYPIGISLNENPGAVAYLRFLTTP
jgi:hypothetical protein